MFLWALCYGFSARILYNLSFHLSSWQSRPYPPIRRFAAIISRTARSEVARTVPELLAWLHAHGYEVIVDPETAKYSNGEEEVARSQCLAPFDLVVC